MLSVASLGFRSTYMKESTTTTKITDGIELLEAEYAMYIMFGEMEKDIRDRLGSIVLYFSMNTTPAYFSDYENSLIDCVTYLLHAEAKKHSK